MAKVRVRAPPLLRPELGPSQPALLRVARADLRVDLRSEAAEAHRTPLARGRRRVGEHLIKG